MQGKKLIFNLKIPVSFVSNACVKDKGSWGNYYPKNPFLVDELDG